MHWGDVHHIVPWLSLILMPWCYREVSWCLSIYVYVSLIFPWRPEKAIDSDKHFRLLVQWKDINNSELIWVYWVCDRHTGSKYSKTKKVEFYLIKIKPKSPKLKNILDFFKTFDKKRIKLSCLLCENDDGFYPYYNKN